VDVWAYSNLEEVELIHPNGTSLGRQKATQCSHVEWPSVAYMPGELSARGYVDGKVVKTSVVRTTGSPVALRIGIIDGVGAEGIVVNGQDVGLVFVEVVDDKGDVVPTASNLITVSTQSGAFLHFTNFQKQGIPGNSSSGKIWETVQDLVQQTLVEAARTQDNYMLLGSASTHLTGWHN
jgi:hypothetical protein